MADPSDPSHPNTPVDQDPSTSRSPYQDQTTQAQDSRLSLASQNSQSSQSQKKKGILQKASTSQLSRHTKKSSMEAAMVETQMEDLTILGPHPQHPPQQYEPGPLDGEWY
ncbi:uncharacterized protein EV420DRAFT_1643270 [Desarmillaria tabescens]|uniref:Uncharacterized protein n=1 Tax=Armillaria tabescens TaxID=1929756 RepID=A0AA39KB67_ARMTA|nr:uncharacterized protein EV420DRAFT_1643270 [Desarmillaria tabescens]KAK0457927.1 hypothetical protein EV420DRAFT_1643270 [Desarmillaria tabescens]